MSGGAGARERGAVALGAAVYLWLVLFRRGTPLFPFESGSNGVFLDEGWRVLAGEVPYRDFFEFVGPGSAYLNAAFMAVFGPTAAGVTWALLLQGVALALCWHALAARVALGAWRLLPPAAFVVLAYATYTLDDHKWPALLCVASGLLLLAGAEGRGRVLAAGAVLGSAAVFTQDLAFGAAVGTLLHLVAWDRGLRRALPFALGCATPVLAAFVAFASVAGAGRVLHDAIVFPVTRYPGSNPFHFTVSLAPRTLAREAAQFALAAGGLAGAVEALRRRQDPAAHLLASAGLGVLAATVHRGVLGALVVVQAALLLPLFARAAAQPGRGRLAWRAALAVVAAGIGAGALGFPIWRQWLQPLVLEEHRAGRVWVTRPLPELTWLERRTQPHEVAFLLPGRAGQHFLTHTRAATSFPYLIEGQSTPAQAQRALAEIRARRPAAGVWDTRAEGAAPREGPVLTPLLDGLRQDYAMERLPSGVLLFSARAQPDGSTRP